MTATLLSLGEVVGQDVPLLGVLDPLLLLRVLLGVLFCPLGRLDGVLRLGLQALGEALLLPNLDLLEQLANAESDKRGLKGRVRGDSSAIAVKRNRRSALFKLMSSLTLIYSATKLGNFLVIFQKSTPIFIRPLVPHE